MKISPIAPTPMPSVNQQGSQVPNSARPTLQMKTNANPASALQTLQQMQAPIANNPEEQKASAATQPISPQLALLAKQKRALQRERELLNQQKAQLTQSQTPSIDVARLKSEPLRVLLENGVTYDQLTQAILAGQGNSEVDTLKAKLEALEQGIDKKFLDRETENEKQVLAQMKRDASQLAYGSDKFEMIKETHSVPTVMQLIERTYRQTGEVLDVPDACQLVEDELFKDAQKLAKLQKMQSFLNPVQAQQAQSMQSQQRPGMRTLTNRDTASIPMSRTQRALAAWSGTLKR